MTAALEGGEWSAAHPGRTLPPGKTRYTFYRWLGDWNDCTFFAVGIKIAVEAAMEYRVAIMAARRMTSRHTSRIRKAVACR